MTSHPALRRSSALVPVGLVLVLPAACGAPTPTSPAATIAEQPAPRMTTAHFRLLADRTGAATVTAVGDALELAWTRITSDLRVTDLPATSVRIWEDSTSFYADMQARAGQVFPGATGWVPDAHTVSMLARPGTPADAAAQTAVHEFAHVVSIGVNPTIGNRPRWLWETAALYESRQFVDPTTVDYMRNGQYPSLAELDLAYEVSGRIYQVGYVLGEYIVRTWGLDGLVRLIQRNGDLAAAIDVTTAAFETGWYAFLHDKYGLPAR
jgi:hypothetical protein